jgi:hypothetical protein
VKADLTDINGTTVEQLMIEELCNKITEQNEKLNDKQGVDFIKKFTAYAQNLRSTPFFLAQINSNLA